ncbi:hypothetical protein B5P44_00965 [Mycobacterium sp. CBMA 213]|nr:pentapeptide repeat-containing protein [Mycolicibacterium sp. CBMA 335]MUM03391.1 hypothetical protein [Mycolicibacterium sp. CBMA 213]
MARPVPDQPQVPAPRPRDRNQGMMHMPPIPPRAGTQLEKVYRALTHGDDPDALLKAAYELIELIDRADNWDSLAGVRLLCEILSTPYYFTVATVHCVVQALKSCDPRHLFRFPEITGLQLPDANLEHAGIDLAEASLKSANLAGASLAGKTVAQANLSGAVLNHADCAKSRFVGGEAHGARFIDAKCDGATFREGFSAVGADFTTARLVGATFDNVDLRGATLIGANLSDATFENVDLRGANLTGAICSYEKWTNVDTTGVITNGQPIPRWLSE